MLIGFETFRSKNNEMIEDSSIRVNIGESLLNSKLEDDDFVVKILEIMQNTLSQYLEQTDYVKKFGIGYVGNMNIRTIIFENGDKIPFVEQEVINEFKTKVPNIVVVWNKEVNYITTDRKIR